MTVALFAYPQQAGVHRPVPKNKIYAHARPPRRIKDTFAAQIEQIVWAYKLAPETVNLPARPGVPEIQVFHLTLKSGELAEAVLRTIDKAIPLPVIYEVIYAGRTKSTAAYKRPSEADSTKWVVSEYLETGWLPLDTPREPLPVALDLAKLYEGILRRHVEIPARPGESLQEHVDRVIAIRAKQRECSRLEAQMQREKQFNRKVELNRRLRELAADLDRLKTPQITQMYADC
jgi:hypothetical protein